MANLTERERIQILMMVGYGDRKRTQQEVCDLFNELNPNKTLTQSTVSKIVKKYDDTGSVKNKAKSGRPKSATNNENALNLLLHVQEDPHVSTRQLARDYNVSQASVCNLMKSVKWHPYKIQLLQELSEDDFDRRSEFCETVMELSNQNLEFVRHIIFSDEATFYLNGTVNRHNCRYWSPENPPWMMQQHPQHPQKVNVWAGVIGNNIIGPFFIEGNLTSDIYLHLLQNSIIPACQDLFPNENNILQEEIWYQQDGAPAHFGRCVTDFLNATFPGRWIGRRGPIEWPPRSPDLNPLDYYLWGYLKCKVYRNRPNNLLDLKQRIRDEMLLISPNTLRKALANFRDRLGHCLAVNGEHFEHLL